MVDLSWASRSMVLTISGLCTFFSVVSAMVLIRGHFRHFTRPGIQSKIIAIIYMVPIYSVDSFLGLLAPSWALYINMLRDCYEVSTYPVLYN